MQLRSKGIETQGGLRHLPPPHELLGWSKIIVDEFGIVKVRLTGGEPLLRSDLPSIARALLMMQPIEHVGVTTNGQLLERRAAELLEAGIGSVNVSLDSLKKERYAKITGGGDLEKTVRGIRAAIRCGIPKVKINCVVMGGLNDDEICDILTFALDEGVEARFLELMPFAQSVVEWHARFVSQEEIIAKISSSFDLQPLTGRGEQTAKMYRVRRNGGIGVAGIIGSSDGKMCEVCNRLRLTADGRLRRCLKDHAEAGLATMVREGLSVRDIRARLRAYVEGKVRPAQLVGRGIMRRIGG